MSQALTFERFLEVEGYILEWLKTLNACPDGGCNLIRHCLELMVDMSLTIILHLRYENVTEQQGNLIPQLPGHHRLPEDSLGQFILLHLHVAGHVDYLP